MSDRSGRARRALLPLFALATLSTAGCFGMDLGLDELFGDTSDPEMTGNLAVRSASLEGEIDEVGVRGPATAVEAWGDTDRIEVSTTVDGIDGAAMTVVEVSSGLPELRPGEQVTLYDSRSGYGGDVYVSVLGCSGPDPGYWQYDSYADATAVLVERRRENPRVYRYTYFAEFSDYTGGVTIMNGAFEIDAP
jgi:hypothetical protein